MSAPKNKLETAGAQRRADAVTATVIGFGALATLCWNVSLAWLALHLLDVL
jgi:hypothetical protein